MAHAPRIEQELAAAEAAWKDANEGKTRVCARRAVALATEAWLARLPVAPWRGDAMEHLRQIQQAASFPLPIRQAAERLGTTVSRRHAAPFTTDPISDARVIVEYLTANTEQKTPRSILDHPTLSRRYFSPRREAPPDIFWVDCKEARLACLYVAPHPGALTLVHFHGNGEVVADCLPEFAADLTALGVNVLFVEYRGYGASSGEPGLARILDDVPAIVSSLPVTPSQLVAFGRSLGSFYAIELVHRFPEAAGLIIESGIADPLERILLRVSPNDVETTAPELAAEVRARLDPQAKLAGYAGPVLVLHAKEDTMVDSSHAMRNASYARRATLRLLPEGDHNSIFEDNREEYLATLAEFLMGIEKSVIV
jgi:alpha-beta hydrolase superfamily lysophospholipase